MILQSLKMSFKPTKLIWEAIEKLTLHLSTTETYVGKWSKADTMRYLLMMSYLEHSYPTRGIKRHGLKAVNLSASQQDQLSKINPKLDENESGCGYCYRLITSGLIQLGYLTVDSEPVTLPNSTIVNNARPNNRVHRN